MDGSGGGSIRSIQESPWESERMSAVSPSCSSSIEEIGLTCVTCSLVTVSELTIHTLTHTKRRSPDPHDRSDLWPGHFLYWRGASFGRRWRHNAAPLASMDEIGGKFMAFIEDFKKELCRTFHVLYFVRLLIRIGQEILKESSRILESCKPSQWPLWWILKNPRSPSSSSLSN